MVYGIYIWNISDGELKNKIKKKKKRAFIL